MALELAISKFSFQYSKESPVVLRDISLNVPAGSICALLGPSNSGKTTLLQSIAGVLGSHHHDAVASGSIRVGDELFAPIPRKILFPIVGLTSQDPYYQISGLRNSVLEEISLTLEALDLRELDIRQRVSQLLAKLGMSHLSLRKPSMLSGGELQRVALANIIVAQPHLLLLDEPCNSLDGEAQSQLAKVICSLKERTSILMSDCQLELAMHTADRFVVMDRGTIAFVGDRSQFLDNLTTFRELLPTDALNRALEIPAPAFVRKRVLKALRGR